MSACLDSKPMVREGKTGDWIGTFIGHKGAVWSARLNQSATIACTASGDFTVKLWNALTGEDMKTLEHKHIVKTACFSSDSRFLLTGGKEKKVRIFDVGNPDAAAAILPMEKDVQQILSPSDSNLMLACDEGKGIHVVDLRTRSFYCLCVRTEWFSAAMFSFVVCGTCGTSLLTGTQRFQRTIPTNAPVTYLHLSADEQVRIRCCLCCPPTLSSLDLDSGVLSGV